MVLEHVKSSKGKDLLVSIRYLFEKDYTKNGKTYWKCIKYNTDKCLGRAHTKDNAVVHHKDEHNHIPNAAEIGAKKLIQKVKETATSQIEATPHQVISQIPSSSQAICAALPSVPAMKKIVPRIRRRETASLSNPLTLAELILIEPYTHTLNNDPFILYDSSVGNDNWILLFSTDENLKILASEQCHWFIDGTFKSSPHLFTQLLTIHTIKFNAVLPLVFALLPNKTKDSYDRVARELLNLNKNLQPATIMTDFEPALFGAFSDVFTNTKIRGCFFHFGQCIWRKIQTMSDIREKYISDADFTLNIKQLMALAFIPVRDVDNTFYELMSQGFFVKHEELLRPLTDYFEDTWIGRPTRRRIRRPPTFSLDLWNQYDATL